MAKERGDILKGLGVKRRRGGATEAPPEDEASEPSGDGASDDEGPKEVKGLGIKRRRAGGGGGGGGQAPGGPGGARGGASAASVQTKREAAESGEGSAEVVEANSALGPARGKLGSDDTAVMLANHFKCRPDLPHKIPARVWDLHRTHGRYSGDGRREREIVVGWEAAYVVWVIPAWPEGQPTFEKKPPFKMIDPGPPPQPRFTERGFVVDAGLNELGEWYYYVVFRSDGEPIQLPEPEPAKAERKPQKRKDEARPRGLGIKRRRK